MKKNFQNQLFIAELDFLKEEMLAGKRESCEKSHYMPFKHYASEYHLNFQLLARPWLSLLSILKVIENALRDLLREEFGVFRSEIKELLKSQNEEQRYLTRKEVARYLGVALSTVDMWSRNGKLRKLNVNGSVRFDKLEIDKVFNNLKNDMQ